MVNHQKIQKNDKIKEKNSKIYGTAMKIFKNKMKSHYGKNELLRFENFNENVDLYNLKNEEDQWYTHLKELQDRFDADHIDIDIDTDIEKYVKGWLKYIREYEDFANELIKYVEDNY
jgi:hypothetical protein